VSLNVTMSNTKVGIRLVGICAFIIVLAIAGLASDLITRLLVSGIDGLLLLMVCLLMGGLFSLMLLVLAWESGLLGSRSRTTTEDAKPAAGK
jgi:hypothetical protein